MTGRMCDEIDLMVWHICGIFFAFQSYLLITRIIELAQKSTIGFISDDVLRARWLKYFQLLMHTALSIVTLTEWTLSQLQCRRNI